LPSEQLAIGFTGLMPGNARQTISSLSVASQQGNLLSVEAVLGRLHMPKHYATWCHTRNDLTYIVRVRRKKEERRIRTRKTPSTITVKRRKGIKRKIR